MDANEQVEIFLINAFFEGKRVALNDLASVKTNNMHAEYLVEVIRVHNDLHVATAQRTVRNSELERVKARVVHFGSIGVLLRGIFLR